MDDRGEITTDLIAAAPTEPVADTLVDEPTEATGPGRVALVQDKDAAVDAEWAAASAAAVELAEAEAARQAAAAATTAPPATAAPAAPSQNTSAQSTPAPQAQPPTQPRPTQPAPTDPPPTSPPDTGGNIYAKLDNIARCESGMNPKAYNPAGPYYGAFQFHISTWQSLGEGGDPRNRSYSYQREVAKRLQARSGWGQWPHCSAQYGYR